jgi:hypothetical protein
MFISTKEAGIYILQRINMNLKKLFLYMNSYISEDNNNIYLNVIIIYNKKKHICILNLKNVVEKNIADIYVDKLIKQIEEKLKL